MVWAEKAKRLVKEFAREVESKFGVTCSYNEEEWEREGMACVRCGEFGELCVPLFAPGAVHGTLMLPKSELLKHVSPQPSGYDITERIHTDFTLYGVRELDIPALVGALGETIYRKGRFERLEQPRPRSKWVRRETLPPEE